MRCKLMCWEHAIAIGGLSVLTSLPFTAFRTANQPLQVAACWSRPAAVLRRLRLGVRRGEPVLAIERRWRSSLPGREANRARFLKRGKGTTQG
jgi:MoxR-like ATPase